jgi:hypothetical protein
LTKAERRVAGRRDDFGLHLAEHLFRGAKHYAPWRSMQEADADSSRRIARHPAERQRLQNARVPSRLSWRGRPHPVGKASGSVPSAEPESTSKAGRPGRYSHLDCYEFVAAVLEENGIRYYGKDGVGNALIEKAKTEHKPSNHFLTGEGLTRLLSSDTVTVNVKGESVQQAWELLEPRLKEGAILSFSSRRAGHTGIVGVREGRWVFINSSGKLGNRRSYRVKEEDLGEEIRSRLAEAKRGKSSLSITLGQVDRDLAAAYRRPESSVVADTRKGRVNLLA